MTHDDTNDKTGKVKYLGLQVCVSGGVECVLEGYGGRFGDVWVVKGVRVGLFEFRWWGGGFGCFEGGVQVV